MSRTVVIGVGNTLRGDDAVGLAVADALKNRVPSGVDVVQCEQEPVRLIDTWLGADSVLLVDAVESGAKAGTVVRLDASSEPIGVRTFRSSTHAFGIGDAIELARALGRLPRRVIVFGIEGAEFSAGPGLTPPVEEAVGAVASAILGEL